MSSPRAPRPSGWLVLVLVFASAYWIFDLAVLGGGVPHPLDDHWEESIIARHLVAGDGYRTDMIYPPLWGFRDPVSLTLPVLVHGPVVPLMMVPALMLFGPTSLDHVAWGAALFAVLTLVPLYRLTTRHFGDFVAAATCVLFTLAPLTLAGVHHSFSVALGAFLIVTVLDLMARAAPRPVLAGLIAGLAYLVRPEMLLGSGILALYAARRMGVPGLLKFAAGFVLAPLPWWYHHWTIAGSPLFNVSSFNLIGSWGSYPGLSVLRDFELTPERFPAAMRDALPGLWRKWLSFFPHGAKHALFSPSGGTGWLALVGVGAVIAATRRAAGDRGHFKAWLGLPEVVASTPRDTRDFVVLAFVLALIPVLTSTIAVYQVLYMVPFMPIYAMGAAVGARFLAERLRVPRIWYVALAALVVPSVVMSLRASVDEARQLAPTVRAERQALASYIATAPGRLVFSDTPDFVAWTTARPTVWVSRAEFSRLYAPGDSTAPAIRLGLPARSEVATWFHDDPRDPASRGAPVAP